MDNKKIKSGIEDIKKINMTSEEKSRIFNNIVSQNPVPSIWASYFLFIKENRFARYAIVAFLIIFGGGGMVSASEESLPNNFLYPVKVQIVEPIKSAMKKTPEEKAQYQSDLVAERLFEAETLASEGKLSKSNEKKISKLLEEHTEEFDQALKNMNSFESADYVQEVVTNFHVEMDAHAKVLEVMTKNHSENEVVKTARINAEKIKINNDLKEEHDSNSDKYRKKKNDVKSMIDSTSIELENIKKDKKVENEIINNTIKNINEAKEKLNEAEKNEIVEENEPEKKAYKALMESESSVREAGIMLNAGLKFKDKINKSKKD